jgi:hypothetical protein
MSDLKGSIAAVVGSVWWGPHSNLKGKSMSYLLHRLNNYQERENERKNYGINAAKEKQKPSDRGDLGGWRRRHGGTRVEKKQTERRRFHVHRGD